VPHASVGDVKLYYEERGSGTPIVGIHGAGSSALFWEDAAEALSDLGRVIVYDRRGCTRSERPAPYEMTSVEEHADDALALMRALDAEPAILIGRSYGGTVALDLALRHPQSVLGIALLEAGPMGLSPDYDAWYESLRVRLDELAADGRVDAVGETVIREVFGAWEELPEAFREVFTDNSLALLAEIRGGEHIENARLGELGVPTLIMTADESPEALQHGSDALVEALPGAKAVRVGGGHAIDPAGDAVRVFVASLIEQTV
jgi:pimeloyl-ACP methyl ester carboxylesterase